MEAMWSGEEQGLQKELSEKEYITMYSRHEIRYYL
jgi:hypothetical protein